MSDAKVIVTIQPDGKVSVQADGWTGPTCSTITEPYAKALGKVTHDEPKPEFFEQDRTTQQEIHQ